MQDLGQPALFSISQARRPADRLRVLSFADLLRFPRERLDTLDIALVNLLCAERLPGAEGLDVSACLDTLDRWAESVGRFTTANRSLYHVNPREYNHHQGVFRFLLMADFLKRPTGIGIRYQPTAIGNYDFCDSRDDMLHGLLTRRLGTCASLPVLAVALGRRLGYPMHLAIAKGHVFCQWVDDRGRTNLEISCPRGGDTGTDEEFARGDGRRAMTEEDKASGRYLRPLTPPEELALFLEVRGHCLADNKRFAAARDAYAQAYAAAPGWSQYDGNLWSLHELERRSQGTLPGRTYVLPGRVRQRTVTEALIPDAKQFPVLYTLPGYTTGLID